MTKISLHFFAAL